MSLQVVSRAAEVRHVIDKRGFVATARGILIGSAHFARQPIPSADADLMQRALLAPVSEEAARRIDFAKNAPRLTKGA